MKFNLSHGMATTMQSGLPIPLVGYRFHPTDEELVNHYLMRKLLGFDDKDIPIATVDICQCEPWDLPGRSKIKSEDNAWYFLCDRHYKYKNSKRSNRTTKAGYWKPTGKPRKVLARSSKKVIGTKKTLVFYKGRSKGERTKWILHEYASVRESDLAPLGDSVLCKLKKKPNGKVKKGVTPLAFDCENQDPNETNANSACDENEPSCDFPQSPTAMTAMSAYEIGESSSQIASDCENQNTDKTTYMSSQRATSDCENQCLNKEAYNLASEVDDRSSQMTPPFDFGNQSPNGMTAMSSYDNGELGHPMVSDCENQNADMGAYISASSEEDWSQFTALPYDFGNKIPNGMAAFSTYDKGKFSHPMTLNFEPQNSDKTTYISSSDEGVWSTFTILPSDMEVQCPYQTTAVSPLVRGDWNRFMIPPSDLENQNPYQNAAGSTQDWNLPTSSSSENGVAGDICPEDIEPQILEVVRAFFEQECSHESAAQPPIHTEESPNYTGFVTSAST